jgi:uncharacterized repeat protein (TIGR01451 family)
MRHKSTCLLVSVGLAVVPSLPSTAWAQAGTNLVIAMSHTGNFTVGENGVYTIVVSNTGGTASSGLITVEDILPSPLPVVAATGNGWSCIVRESCLVCPGATSIVDCTSSTAIALGGSASPITLTVLPDRNGIGTVTNTVSVSGGGSPDNSASDPTIIVAAVPTLPQWAMMALTVLLVLAGVAALRRRTT